MNSQIESTFKSIDKRFKRGRSGEYFPESVHGPRHHSPPHNYLTPVAALHKEMMKKSGSLVPSTKRFVEGLLTSIMEGYVTKPYLGGRVGPVVNVMFVKPSLDIQAIAGPSFRPVANPDVHPTLPQVPALFVDLPWHKLTTDAVASAILQALRKALPRENLDMHFPRGTRGLRLVNMASDLIDAYSVGCIVVRNTQPRSTARAGHTSKLASVATSEKPTVLRLMSMLSSGLNVSVLFATERKNEDPAELKLALDARLSVVDDWYDKAFQGHSGNAGDGGAAPVAAQSIGQMR